MRIVHLSFSDSRGGAAIGAYRLHRAMLDAGLDSHMLVIHKGHREEEIHPLLNKQTRKIHLRSVEFNKRLKSLYNIKNLPIRSFNLRGTDTARVINELDPDIVQMHWIGLNTIRIDDIKNITAPVFWKLPDMWAFSGAEHYTNADEPQRHREGYDAVPCFRGEAADIDRMVWEYKKTHYPDITSLTIISPSRFLAHEAHRSALLGDRNCHVIPNPLPTYWLDLEPATESEKNRFREELGISGKKLVIFFGAFQTAEKRKGFHHIEAMVENHLPDIISRDDLAFIVAGGEELQSTSLHGYDVHIYPCTPDFRQYSSYLRSSDLLMLPSEMENSAMVIQEALACGIPAITFDIGGMPDLVHHRKSGYLAAPYKSGELADGIRWWLGCGDREFVRTYSRNLARSAHDPKRCATRYVTLYQDILEKTRTGRPVCNGNLFDHDPERAVPDEPVRIFIIASSVQDWTDSSGEADVALAIHDLATAQGISSCILTGRDCKVRQGGTIEPVLAGDLSEAISGLAAERKLNGHDALFFPAIDHTQAEAILNLIALNDHPDSPCFHLYLLHRNTDFPENSHPVMDILRAINNTSYSGKRIFLYTHTKAMAERLSSATGLNFTALAAQSTNAGSCFEQGTLDIGPLVQSVVHQGLTKNETILCVNASIDETLFPERTGNMKIVFLSPEFSEEGKTDKPFPFPRPGEQFFIRLVTRHMSGGSWLLPGVITTMLNTGKISTIVLGNQVPQSLAETLKHECYRFGGVNTDSESTSGIFVDAETFHDRFSVNKPLHQQKRAKRKLLSRLGRKALRRGRNLLCRLCRR